MGARQGDMTPQKLAQEYERRLNLHSPGEVAKLIADDAVFWFNDGSYKGVTAIKAALADVWRTIYGEHYELRDVRWLCQDTTCAVCIYTFHWSGLIEGNLTHGQGRGTSVFRKENGVWRIVHEHLSTPS